MRLPTRAAVMLVILVASFVPHADEALARSIPERASLKGVGTLTVVLDGFDVKTELLGLTADRARTLTEAALRKAAVTVIPNERDVDAPYLHVMVLALDPEPDGSVSYTISVRFRQLVRLDRDPTKVMFATTWETGGAGHVGRARRQMFREQVMEYVDQFINDLAEANLPPRAAPPGWERDPILVPAPPRP